MKAIMGKNARTKKIINFNSFVTDMDSSYGYDLLIEISNTMEQMYEILKEKNNNELNKHKLHIESLQIENQRMSKMVETMRLKLKKCIPMHTIAYLLINTCVISISAVLLFLRFAMQIYVVDPYYLICALLISMTLFLTALRSLYDWRKLLNGKDDER